MTKVDILVISVHPDDAELGCGATIAKHVAKGKTVGIVDLTRGELGTRGTPEIRAKEAEEGRKILGVAFRENLDMADGFFANDSAHQLEIIKAIRSHQPEIVLANAISDRHPDHGRAATLIRDACFYSGLAKISTVQNDEEQMAWRPKKVYHFIQSNYIQPDFVVDVSEYWETKMKAIRAFKSQFDGGDGDDPQTFLTTPLFMNFIEARGKELGHAIGAAYGEGFTVNQPMGVNSLYHLVI
ncbi:bacillithiol biosynthesis deacetylase BshB1 [Tunicatimonas pelagia]|uniref:bacillithiol biosynthesis deacetylase BshB1 n=1 Tax=Tunicatimonas pelagia TaxID=931531 RepID=UPI0026665F64|nr:bacillithiol biosynthesis deacetylase BshB1 [Tunicatimonas pelagia]WKN43263.1 bacillithiol biosynthesis deacetylase BshB1 [Tunicatimonas pelagia]